MTAETTTLSPLRFGPNRTSQRELIDVALGEAPADRVIVGGKLVNVFTAEIYPADVAIKGDRIAFVGKVTHTIGPETEEIHAQGMYLTPGLIDTHQHSYEAHLNMTEYARLLLSRGTTTVSEAFYGLGIVRGIEAVRFCLEELARSPIKNVFLAPVLAYLQNRDLHLPPTPVPFGEKEILEILDWAECRGLEEPPVIPFIEKDPFWLDLAERALQSGMVITGHASGLNERESSVYAIMGVASDHESVDAEEARMKARLGLRISMREGSGAQDVKRLSKLLAQTPIDARYFNQCGDEVDFMRIVRHGHLDNNLRLAVSQGVGPIVAVQMATINAAEQMKVADDVGAVAPGKYADILLVEDLADFRAAAVLAGGEVVARDGSCTSALARPPYPANLYNTVELPGPISADDFVVRPLGPATHAEVRVIGMTPGSLISDERRARLAVAERDIPADIDQDVLKIAMIDRYGRGRMIGVGYVQGFNLEAGAIASTYTPLTENIILVGTNNQDLALAAAEVARMGGGWAVVQNGEVLSSLPLPLCGLLYDGDLETATARAAEMYRVVRDLGCTLPNGPFHALAFMGVCGEIGHLKIWVEGLFDVHQRRVVPTVIG